MNISHYNSRHRTTTQHSRLVLDFVWTCSTICNRTSIRHTSEIGVNRTGVRKRIREEELECYAKGFQALRANAGGISKRAAEAAQHRISHLRAHLELLSQMRTLHPDVLFYLSDNWEKRTVQDEMDMFVKKVHSKPRKADTWYRKYEEKREAGILQELEKVLVDIVGGESTKV